MMRKIENFSHHLAKTTKRGFSSIFEDEKKLPIFSHPQK
jgi:hypothetical protein